MHARHRLIVIRSYAKAAWTSLWQPLLQDCLWGVGWRFPKFMSGEGGSHFFVVVNLMAVLSLLEMQPRRWWLKLAVDAVAKTNRFTKMTVNSMVCLFRLSLPSSSTATCFWTPHYTNARTERKWRTDNKNCLTIEPMNPKSFVWDPPPSTERCAFEASAP